VALPARRFREGFRVEGKIISRRVFFFCPNAVTGGLVGRGLRPAAVFGGIRMPNAGREFWMRDAWERTTRFFRQVWAELRRVVWPNRQQTVAYTAVVLGTVAFVAALIWILDFAIRELIGLVIPG